MVHLLLFRETGPKTGSNCFLFFHILQLQHINMMCISIFINFFLFFIWVLLISLLARWCAKSKASKMFDTQPLSSVICNNNVVGRGGSLVGSSPFVRISAMYGPWTSPSLAIAYFDVSTTLDTVDHACCCLLAYLVTSLPG